MKTMTRRATLAVLVTAGAVALAACGGSDPAGNGTDRAFAAEMIPHHTSAVAMAKLAQERGSSAFVKGLADDIVASQTKEIATLRREDRALADDGVKRGTLGVPSHMMGMDDDPSMLRSASPFDAAFIKMMIPHHEGAITMAKAELAKGQDPELKALATAIIAAQQREITEMKRQTS